MRGEHQAIRRSAAASAGPSPHARGTLQARCFVDSWEAVHPRMRGEHSNYHVGVVIDSGPSPHARGTHHASGVVHAAHRSIPACAGNTSSLRSWARRSPVHPRMRGEHGGACPDFGTITGPSPHARGTRLHRRTVALILRSIPACAGNTTDRWLTRKIHAVHPRMRGEHMARASPTIPRTGPSPHARGTRPSSRRRPPRSRSIPACAGNTIHCTRRAPDNTVHPRMRGEHMTVEQFIDWPNGPSPHARGTRHRCSRRAA